ncbi:MAG: hypothetical protein WD895_00885 [Acidimicrobiia bacterium]
MEPITFGPFAEDREEFVAKLDDLIESLAPRDAFEYATATRLAMLMISFDRLERWSVARIVGASRMANLDYEAGVGSEPLREAQTQSAWLLHDYLKGEVSDEEADFPTFATLVRFYGPNPRVVIEGLWDDTKEPESDADWMKAFESLLAHHWPDETRALVWAHRLATRFERELEEVLGLEEERAASRIMSEPMDLQFKYFARIRKELTEMTKEYTELQKRQLPALREPNPAD